MTRCEHVEDVAAWALGALDADRAERFAAHVESCEICRAELDELTPVADVLSVATTQIAPPAALRDRVMQTVRAEARPSAAAAARAGRPRAERRRHRFGSWRPALGAAVACGLLAAGVVTGIVIDRDGRSTPTRTFQANAKWNIKAAATIDSDHVTLHLADMKAPPAGRVYQVWLRRAGRVVPTSTLFVPSNGEATVMVDKALDGADRVMISDEKMGGSRTPTGEVCVDAKLS